MCLIKYHLLHRATHNKQITQKYENAEVFCAFESNGILFILLLVYEKWKTSYWVEKEENGTGSRPETI